MDTRELQCFLAVYTEKSLNRAAGKLHITSQGLSRIIIGLEDELQVQLFVRTPKGVEPTPSGVFLYGAAKELLQQFRAVADGVRQLAEQSAHLRIACAGGVLNALSFDAILPFMQARPSARIEWSEFSNKEAKERVRRFEADIGLVVGTFEDKNIAATCVAKRRIVLLVHKTHPFYTKDILSISDLKQEKIIILSEDYHINGEFRRKCAQYGFTPNIVAETADNHFLYKLCKLPFGVGVTLDFATDHFDMRDLRTIPLQEEFTWDIYAIMQRQHTSLPLMQEFQTHLAHMEQSRKDILPKK